MRNVAVLGASPKKDRYSYKAMSGLLDKGHNVIPVNPYYADIEGRYCADTVSEAAGLSGEEGLDTLTLYLAPHHLEALAGDIILARPNRVIFNTQKAGTSNQNSGSRRIVRYSESYPYFHIPL